MVMLRPPGKPYKIAKKVMKQEGVKVKNPKGGKAKIPPQTPFLQH